MDGGGGGGGVPGNEPAPLPAHGARRPGQTPWGAGSGTAADRLKEFPVRISPMCFSRVVVLDQGRAAGVQEEKGILTL